MIIAFDLYQPCGSFYHSLHQNLPHFAEEFTSIKHSSYILMKHALVITNRDNKNIGGFLYVSLSKDFGAT